MTIKFDDLVKVLLKTGTFVGDALPSQALSIDFRVDESKVHDSITHHLANGGLLVIDVDKSGKVLSIEIV